MTHKLINTGDYLLIVDDSEIKEGEWYLNQTGNVIEKLKDRLPSSGQWCKKIIAHLPLNNSPILEGVDLLPLLEYEPKGFDEYKYTEEDLKNEIIRAFKYGQSNAEMMEAGLERDEINDYTNNRIQSLQQPKMPIGFEREIEVGCIDNGKEINQYKVSYNSQGLTQWVGEYIY